MNSWTIAGVVVGVISVVVAIIFGVLQLRGRRSSAGEGGKGGNATVRGKSSTAIGGRGGGGGVGGRGGAGGDATVTGDNAFALGGEGGEAGQADRGGRGGRSPLEVLEEMGLGDDTSRFMLLYGKLGQEYAASHGGVSPNPLPEEWVNERLQELGHPWGVKNTASGFELVFHASRLVDITWMVVTYKMQLVEGRPMMMLMGPFPSSSMCDAMLKFAQEGLSRQGLELASSTCRKDVTVAIPDQPAPSVPPQVPAGGDGAGR